MLTRSAMSIITSVGEQYVALQAEFYKHSASLPQPPQRNADTLHRCNAHWANTEAAREE